MPRLAVLLVAGLTAIIALRGQIAGDQQRPSTLRALSMAAPSVQWDSKSIVTGNIGCDGRSDYAYLGRSADRVYVGLVRAGGQRPEILEFRVGGDHQDAICEEPAKLALEPLDYDLDDVKGFRRSRVCKGLVLSGGECDPIHNRARRRLNWWRN